MNPRAARMSDLPVVLLRSLASYLDFLDHFKFSRCSKALASVCEHAASFCSAVNLLDYEKKTDFDDEKSTDITSSVGLMKILGRVGPRTKFVMSLQSGYQTRDLNLNVDQLYWFGWKDVDVEQLRLWQPKFPVRALHCLTHNTNRSVVLPVLRKFNQIHKLVFWNNSDVFQLSNIRHLQALTDLDLHVSGRHIHMRDLLHLKALKTLKLTWSGLTRPDAVDLYELPIVSLVIGEEHLRQLMAARNIHELSIPMLPHCGKLVVRQVDSPLQSYFGDLQDELPKLDTLEIDCTKINPDADTSGWIHPLRYLRLDHLHIELPGPIRACELASLPTTLGSLTLRNAQVTADLHHLVRLRELTLTNCDITDLLHTHLPSSVKQLTMYGCKLPVFGRTLPKLLTQDRTVRVPF